MVVVWERPPFDLHKKEFFKKKLVISCLRTNITWRIKWSFVPNTEGSLKRLLNSSWVKMVSKTCRGVMLRWITPTRRPTSRMATDWNHRECSLTQNKSAYLYNVLFSRKEKVRDKGYWNAEVCLILVCWSKLSLLGMLVEQWYGNLLVCCGYMIEGRALEEN